MAKINKPFLLLATFADVWSQSYHGEVYEKSPRDFKLAKEYIDLNDGNFSPDNIVAKARIYLSMNGLYAENRHSFRAFVNNIGSFVAERGKVVSAPKQGRTRCGVCNEMIPDSRFLEHNASHLKVKE